MLKKYFYSALAVLILIGAVCYINSLFVDSIVIKAIDYTDKALECVQNSDMEKACSLTLELNKYWHDKREYLESFLIHAEVDKITETVSNFVSAGLTGDIEDFVRTQMLLVEQLSHMSGIEKLLISNVL